MADKICYYETLGIERTADSETIKKAYRSMALKFHPDRNPGDVEAEARFKEAAEAYEVLSNQEKRRLYDQYGHDGVAGAGFQNGFQGFGDIFSAFGDIFQDFFGGAQGASQSRARRGRDLGYEAVIEFTEAYSGASLELKIPREENCQSCAGSGSRSGHRETCRQCGGQGQVYQGRGFIRMATTCPICRGQGTIAADPCPDCQGLGRVKRTRELTVKVPAGVDTGARLRLRGEGEAGYNGGPDGDLYVELIVRRHEYFSRERQHVLLERRIDLVNAALGGEIEVPTVMGGTEKLKVPAGIQNGKSLRISGLGFPNPSGGPKGDLVVTFAVETPRDLSERQEEILREFAAIEAAKKGESTLKRFSKKVGKKLRKALG